MKKTLAIIILFSFMAASAGFAESADAEKTRLEKIERELREKKAELLETKQKEQQSLSQLAEIKNKLKKTKRLLSSANRKIIVNENELKYLTTEIKETDLLLKQKESRLKRRVREIFKGSSVNYLELMLGARNMSDFINRSYFFSKLVEIDVALLDEVSTKYHQISQKKDRLQDVTTEIKELAVVISDQKEEISKQEKEEQEVYVNLRERRADYEKRIAQLEKSSIELTEIIRKKVAQRGFQTRIEKASGVLDWPLRNRITSGYGYRRHPLWGGRHLHTGIDVGAPYGTPIKAADGGQVILSEWWDGYGKAVVIDHGGDVTTVYGHLSRIYVDANNYVAKGQIIGLVGSTGYSTGPHLHFEVRINGKPTNPMRFLP